MAVKHRDTQLQIQQEGILAIKQSLSDASLTCRTAILAHKIPRKESTFLTAPPRVSKSLSATPPEVYRQDKKSFSRHLALQECIAGAFSTMPL